MEAGTLLRVTAVRNLYSKEEKSWRLFSHLEDGDVIVLLEAVLDLNRYATDVRSLRVLTRCGVGTVFYNPWALKEIT